jgi:hypothetical protein
MSFTTTVFSQGNPNPADYDIAHCKSLEEITAAKEAGKDFIEIRGSYMAKIGDKKYTVLYPSLRRAIAERDKYVPTSKSNDESAIYTGKTYYNPLSIIFPFTEIAEDQSVQFEIMDGIKIPSTKVMLHAEPFSFDQITFGPLNFKQKGFYFAIAGHFSQEETIKAATGELEYFVGASVVSKTGDVIWKQYGNTGKDQGFHCLAEVKNMSVEPEFLLIFLLAKGKLDKQLSRLPNFPDVDAKPYEYHVLSSIALEIAPNWLPPLDAIAQEEYLKLYREEQQKHLDNPKSGQKAKPFGN